MYLEREVLHRGLDSCTPVPHGLRQQRARAERCARAVQAQIARHSFCPLPAIRA
jgi:hypothetical protein